MRSEYDITPQQYHAGLDKLWVALGVTGPQEKDVFTLAAEAIEASRPGSKVIYYRKVGGRMRQITPLNDDLSPTHEYIHVDSWKAARQALIRLHQTDRVHESSEMFKVLK